MKRKTLLTILLSLCMVMTTMVPAFADTMTLNNSKSGITWMQVRNGAQTMWVGIDYSNADVGVGSTFHADWITADDATYHDVFNNIDDNIKSTLTDNHCVLRVGITDRDGKEILHLRTMPTFSFSSELQLNSSQLRLGSYLTKQTRMC